ncbi:hypothetical protein, partial [Pseudonocardia phyllosphaerae]|uniref:hypothetical protein n=1 Tax=Pseudonocardia phyllosphaerae TaxID=3390502 RepID=UPI00397A88F2
LPKKPPDPTGSDQTAKTIWHKNAKPYNLARHTVEFSKDTRTTSPTAKPNPKADHLVSCDP